MILHVTSGKDSQKTMDCHRAAFSDMTYLSNVIPQFLLRPLLRGLWHDSMECADVSICLDRTRSLVLHLQPRQGEIHAHEQRKFLLFHKEKAMFLVRGSLKHCQRWRPSDLGGTSHSQSPTRSRRLFVRHTSKIESRSHRTYFFVGIYLAPGL